MITGMFDGSDYKVQTKGRDFELFQILAWYQYSGSPFCYGERAKSKFYIPYSN